LALLQERTERVETAGVRQQEPIDGEFIEFVRQYQKAEQPKHTTSTRRRFKFPRTGFDAQLQVDKRQ
jgi:hypothetical protein